MTHAAARSSAGYTLIEMLVYVATVTIGASLIVLTLLGFGKAYLTYKAAADVHRSASFAMERMLREARAASSVAVPSSTLGTSPGVLVLNVKDAGGFATTMEFAVQEGVLMVRSGAGAYSPLISKGVAVTSFMVEHFDGAESDAIRIKLALERSRGAITKSATFWSGTVLRGSYVPE